MSMGEWESVIGLEVHVQLATKSKMFSASATDFGAEPNVQANEVDLALPGTLPVANAEAIRMSVKFGLAINAEIGKYNQFVRKNYFYPDLPKGYQISQLEYPIVGKGEIKIELEESDKIIGITRAHLEEDAGKSLHEDFHGMSGMDYNRAGTALMEIVSEPELRSAAEAVAYLKAINSLVRYLDISDGDMSRGSMRCDANVSVRKKGEKEFGQRAEIKNVNSYRFVEKAINYEIERQIALLESGERVVQETRLYDAENNETRAMRSKEESHDYRYFPDPDLLPVEVTDEMIADIKSSMVELPQQKQARFISDFGISEYDAKILVAKLSLANYYERVQAICGDSKLAANWVTSELLGALNKEGLEIEDTPLSADILGSLLLRIKDKTISGKIAKEIFQELFQNPNADSVSEANGQPDELAEKENNLKMIDAIIESKGLSQISDQTELEDIAAKIIADNPQQVADFRDGKDRLFGYFVGQMMKATGGRADPKLANELLMKKLKH